MKNILSLLFLSTVCAWSQPILTNLTFTWDVSPNATGYKFYYVQGTNVSNRILAGTSLTNTYVAQMWNVLTSRTVTVTATNMLGESEPATPLVVPPAPTPVQHLAPIPLSIVSPLPGVIEISQDLKDWLQRIRLVSTNVTNVLVTWVQYPLEPMTFMRTKLIPVQTALPLP